MLRFSRLMKCDAPKVRVKRILTGALPPGRTVLPISAGYEEILKSLNHSSGKDATVTAGQDPQHHVRVVDSEKGLVEVMTPHKTGKHKSLDVTVICTPRTSSMIPSTAMSFAQWTAHMTRMVKQAVFMGADHKIVKRGTEEGFDVASIPGGRMEDFFQAAQKAAHHGRTLILVNDGGRLDASSVPAASLALNQPHQYRHFFVRLDVQKPHHSSPPLLGWRAAGVVNVVVPLPAQFMSGIRCKSPVLQRALEAFHAVVASSDALLNVNGNRGSTAASLDHVQLDPTGALAAYSRMRAVILQYLESGRISLPHPLPLCLLHHELHWDDVEDQLGSVTQAVPETELLRFGCDLILPVTTAYFNNTVMPLLNRFVDARPQYFRSNTGVLRFPVVEFFEWVWSTAIADAAVAHHTHSAAPSASTPTSAAAGCGLGERCPKFMVRVPSSLLQDVRDRMGPLAAYEGHLCRWFQSFPQCRVGRQRYEPVMYASMLWRRATGQ